MKSYREITEIVFNNIYENINYYDELEKGILIEKEHESTLRKELEGKINVTQGIIETAKTHLDENPMYYTELCKTEDCTY